MAPAHRAAVKGAGAQGLRGPAPWSLVRALAFTLALGLGSLPAGALPAEGDAPMPGEPVAGRPSGASALDGGGWDGGAWDGGAGRSTEASDGGAAERRSPLRAARREPLARRVDDARVERVAAGLGLRGCAAQLLLAYPQIDRVAPVEVGGLLFVGGMLRQVPRARERIVGAQARAAVPLLVAADVEGGATNRLKSVAALRELPSARALAELPDELVRDWGRSVGRAMRAVGLNVNLAPVLDVAASGHMAAKERSFSGDPDVVAAKAGAFARGLLAEGVVPIGKHFPGYGDLSGDSDRQLVRCDWTRERIEREAAAFDQVGPALAGVMLANVVYAAIDGRPAVLSPDVVALAHGRGWLTVTDDLSIPLLADAIGGSPREVLAGALLAGNDLLLTTAPPDWEKGIDPIGTLVALAESDAVARRRVGEACRRVLRLKDRMGLLDGR